MKEKRNIIILVVTVVGISTLLTIAAFLLPAIIMATSKVEVITDINKYTEVIGKTSKDVYKTKWGLNEEIFPEKIKDSYEVKDFKMVYYNPWDANYLAYIVIDYNEEDYDKEINRLNKFGIEEYTGYYEVTGITKYELLAMDADSYNGFIYAMTDRENKKIIYVEIEFCNYFMDIEYNKYISKDYLPDGFDATIDNPYSKKHRN